MAHKIQTYQVIGRQKDLGKNNMVLNEEHEGFNLNIDFNISKKVEVVAYLKKILKNIQED